MQVQMKYSAEVEVVHAKVVVAQVFHRLEVEAEMQVVHPLQEVEAEVYHRLEVEVEVLLLQGVAVYLPLEVLQG